MSKVISNKNLCIELRRSYMDMVTRERITMARLRKSENECTRLRKKLNKFRFRKSLCNATGLMYIENINNYLNAKLLSTMFELAGQMTICESCHFTLNAISKERIILDREAMGML